MNTPPTMTLAQLDFSAHTIRNNLEWVVEPFTYSFMQRAFLVASITAVVAGLLSCWLILIGWSLMGDAVSHAVLPGVVIAYIAGVPFALGALAAAVVAVGLVGTVRERTTLREDTSIGIVFTAMFALGLVLVSITPAGTNLQEILFGNLLGTTRGALVQVAVFGGLALLVMLVRKKDITLWAFDAAHARSVGVNVTVLRWTVLLTLALVVVASMQAVGVILVVAMLITPGATAYLLTQRMRRMLLLAPAVAWLSSVAGMWLSFRMDVSTGGMIVLVQACVFALVWLFGKREGIVTLALRRRRMSAS